MNEQGLLTSQIGYDLTESKRALVRGPRDLLKNPRFALRHGDTVMFVGEVRFWGERWNSFWWVADFSQLERSGTFQIEVFDGELLRFSDEIRVGERLLWRETALLVSIEQAERRQKVAWKVDGEALGWFDAGMPWQEANSHACFLLGLCDLWEKNRKDFTTDQKTRLLAQLQNGGNYLAHLQDLAFERGFGRGAVLHQCFFTQGYSRDFCNPSDVSKSALAWARLSAVLPQELARQRDEYKRRSLQSLDWLLDAPRFEDIAFLGFPHGLPDDFKRPDSLSTPDLSAILGALVELDDPRAFGFAEQLLTRQVTESQAQNGVWGHFRLFENHSVTEKMWTHGVGREGYGWNNGQTLGHNLFPLFRLLEKFSDHPDAPKWKNALEAYLRGYFLPACAANPFKIVPNGHVADEGFLHFAGLWHGSTAIYGLGAALALELACVFDEAILREIATANLGWIAGLNVGITAENIAIGSELWNTEIPKGVTLAASLICGVGARWAGSWLQIRGSICNGYSHGAQFAWDVEPRSENDFPGAFTDEDWITHAGGFLMGLSRWNAALSNTCILAC